MYQLKLTLLLTMTLAFTQFACGRSSYKSLLLEKNKSGDAQPSSGDGVPAVPESLEADPADEPVLNDGEEAPIIEKPCVKLSLTEDGLELGESVKCPVPTPPPPAVTPPVVTTPPVTDNPSQN